MNLEPDHLVRDQAGNFFLLKIEKNGLRITNPILSVTNPDFCGQPFRHKLLRNDSKFFLIFQKLSGFLCIFLKIIVRKRFTVHEFNVFHILSILVIIKVCLDRKRSRTIAFHATNNSLWAAFRQNYKEGLIKAGTFFHNIANGLRQKISIRLKLN